MSQETTIEHIREAFVEGTNVDHDRLYRAAKAYVAAVESKEERAYEKARREKKPGLMVFITSSPSEAAFCVLLEELEAAVYSYRFAENEIDREIRGENE